MRLPTGIAALAVLLAPVAVQAEQPNIQPGEWEYENVTTFEGDMDIPEQRETTTECVTQEDIDEGLIAPDEAEMGECEIIDQNISSSEMTYTMQCVDEEGGQMTMNAEMQFHGDRATGTIHGDMETAMGQMQVETRMEGQRIGDC